MSALTQKFLLKLIVNLNPRLIIVAPNRQWALIAGPLLAIAVAAGMNQSGWEGQACWTGAVAILCVVWWIF